MRRDDFWIGNGMGDAYFNDDLIREVRQHPLAGAPDLEVAIALASLLRDEFEEFGTSRMNALTADQSRECMRALIALAARVGVEFAPPFRDFPSFYTYWLENNASGSWAARRTIVGTLFDPLRAELEAREDAELLDPLVAPISPRATGWRGVDESIAEMRRHFNSARTPRDYANVGNDATAVLEALSAAAYNRERHLFDGETEPPVASTKNRIGRIIEVDFRGEGSAEMISLAKRAIEFAQAVKHNTESTRTRAGIAADSVLMIANLVRRVQEPE